jgi:hypothetical protein
MYILTLQTMVQEVDNQNGFSGDGIHQKAQYTISAG